MSCFIGNAKPTEIRKLNHIYFTSKAFAVPLCGIAKELRVVEMNFPQRNKRRLPNRNHCLNLSYMRATLTISLPPVLRRDVSLAAKVQRVSESEFVRRAVQRQLWTDAFEETRRKIAPSARAQGIYTDEDVFKMIS